MMCEKDKLRQAKKRDKKIEITDIAIEKVPHIEYKGFTPEQNDIMQQLVKEVLILSFRENSSNEVAITCDMEAENPLEEYGISFGGEFDVDVCSDTRSYHLLNSGKNTTVVLVHNHPSTKTFSLVDLHFLLVYTRVKMLVVVSNQGTVHYIQKDKKFDRQAAVRLIKECADEYNISNSVVERYRAALTFLVRCSEVGLFYS